MRPPLPRKLIETAQEYAAGDRTPAEPRDAATVVLVRPGAPEPEVYLLVRQRSMAFAAGAAVFPGGGVDPRDYDAQVGWAGPSPAEWAARLGVSEERARALVCAAVRETFEESGVLLAGPSAEGGDSVVADVSGDDWEADRMALESREVSLTALLERRGLVLRTDLLGVWSGWLTPEFEPRRYRTWFFVAVLPDGQVTRDVSSESSSVTWLPLLEACARVERSELTMLAPTYATCLEIGQHASPADVLATAAGREVEMFMPTLTQVDGEWTLSSPDRLGPLLAARAAQ